MRIAIIGAKGNDSMESNLLEAFSFANHECQIFDIYDLSWTFQNKRISKYSRTIDKLARTYSDTYDRRIFQHLALKVIEWSPCLVVCVYRFIHPCFVDCLKNSLRGGVKVIHVNPDAM